MNGEHRSVMTSASVNICAPPATPRFRCIQNSDTKVLYVLTALDQRPSRLTLDLFTPRTISHR